MITILHRGGYAQKITILHREGGVFRDPQKWLRNLWMTPYVTVSQSPRLTRLLTVMDREMLTGGWLEYFQQCSTSTLDGSEETAFVTQIQTEKLSLLIWGTPPYQPTPIPPFFKVSPKKDNLASVLNKHDITFIWSNESDHFPWHQTCSKPPE